MAIKDYKFVYRDGANTGATVQTFRWVDTLAELGTGLLNGDLGYNNAAGNDNRLYIWIGGTWYKIPLAIDIPAAPAAFNGGRITQALFVDGVPNLPTAGNGHFASRYPGYNSIFRIFTYSNETYIMHNMNYAWARDDANYPGHLFTMQSGNLGFGFYVITSGNTLTEVGRISTAGNFSIPGTVTCAYIQNNGNNKTTGSIDADGPIRGRGNLYESTRAYAIGAKNDFTPSMTAVSGATITGLTNHGCWWSLVGNTMTINIFVDITTNGNCDGYRLTLPGGATCWAHGVATGIANTMGYEYLPIFAWQQPWTNVMDIRRTVIPGQSVQFSTSARVMFVMNLAVYNI